MLPHFLAFGRTKYSLEALLLQFQVEVDGVPCSALEGHVETPPLEGGTATGGKLTANCSLH